MWDYKQAGRLLRQDWETPTDLARELYSMFTNKESRKGGQSGSIETSKGQTGSLNSRDKPSILAGPNKNSVTNINKKNQTQPQTPQFKQESIRSEPPTAREKREAPDAPFARPQDREESPSYPKSIDQKPTESNLPPGTRSKPAASNRSLRNSQVQSGPEFKPVRPEAGQAGPGIKPGSKQPFESSGEVRFNGIKNPDLERPAQDFTPKLDEYSPYDWDGSLTRIPLGKTGTVAFWGQVVSGQGDTYMMNLFEDPDPESQRVDFVEVKIVGDMDAEEKLPILTWVYPVSLNADGTKWYGLVPMWV